MKNYNKVLEDLSLKSYVFTPPLDFSRAFGTEIIKCVISRLNHEVMQQSPL